MKKLLAMGLACAVVFAPALSVHAAEEVETCHIGECNLGECFMDTDGDGICGNHYFVDEDGDGICDFHCYTDTNTDGMQTRMVSVTTVMTMASQFRQRQH